MQKHLDKLHKLNKKPDAAKNRVLKNYKQNAKNRNLCFLLSDQEFKVLIKGKCFYCGASPLNVVNEHNYNYYYNGIDRIDSNLGYFYDNCVSCCIICNDIKGKLSINDFFTQIERIYIKLFLTN